MKQAVTRVWSRYAVFTGRASRPEFWWWVLFVFILMALTRALDAWIVVPALGIIPGPGGSAQPLSALVSLVLLLPAIGVAVRRLHDSNRSGWWFLLVLRIAGSDLFLCPAQR